MRTTPEPSRPEAAASPCSPGRGFPSASPATPTRPATGCSDRVSPDTVLSETRSADPRLLAAGGVLFTSLSAIWVSLAAVSPLTTAFFRTAYALPVLYLVSWRLRSAPRSPRDRVLALLAGTLLATDLVLWHRSIELVGAGLATVLVNTQVVFVGLLAWALYNERPHRRTLFVVPGILAGTLLISGLGGDDAFGADPVRGTVLGLLGALAYTAFLLLLRTASRSTRNGAAPLADATLAAAAVSLLTLPLGGSLDLVPAWPAHAWLVVLALLGHVLGWLLIGAALPRLPALESSVILVLQPALTMLWAAIFLNERASPVQWSGVVLVLAGIVYLSLRGTVDSPRQPRRP